MLPSAVQYVLGPGATWTDVGRSVVDVAVLGYLFYRVLLLIRGTRAIRVLAGLFVLSAAYLVSQANLVTVKWFLGSFLSYVIFGMIVLFQADIGVRLPVAGNAGAPARATVGAAPSRSRPGSHPVSLDPGFAPHPGRRPGARPATASMRAQVPESPAVRV